MKKIERKDFLKLGGGAVVGGLTGWVFSGAPFLGFQWLVEWSQDQYVPVKGMEKYVQAVNDACPYGCSVTVKKIGERAVKLEAKDGICPSCQNALQLLYHPERIGSPLKNVGKKGSGKFQPVPWEQALKDISARTNALLGENKGNTIAAINKNENSTAQMLEKFTRAAGSKNVYYESSLKSISAAALGGYESYNFDKAGHILSFGAKLVEGWGNPAEMQKQFAGWKKKGVKVVQADSVSTRTASIADQWIPVKPGTEAVLAFGIANYLITSKRLNSPGTGFAKWSQIIINKYPLSKVAKITGIKEETIRKTADEFYKAKNPVAVAGKGAYGVSASSAELIAVHCLNSLVKSPAASLRKNSAVSFTGEYAGLDQFIKDGSFNLLFVNGANPVYKSTLGDDLKEKMKKAFVVSFGSLIDDTANYADYILPSLTFLETEDAVAGFAKSKDVKNAIAEISSMVKKTRNLFPSGKFTAKGKEVSAGQKFSFQVDKTKDIIEGYEKKLAASADYPLTMIPIEAPLVGDGDGLAFPYVTKAVDSHTYFKGKLWVQINRETGKTQNISEGESIVIESARGKLGKVYVHLTDTVSPDTIAIPLGFGHESYTRYGTDKGVNPRKIMTADVDPLTGTADWWSTRVKIS